MRKSINPNFNARKNGYFSECVSGSVLRDLFVLEDEYSDGTKITWDHCQPIIGLPAVPP